MSEAYYLAMDIGTSSTKVALFSPSGRMQASRTATYPTLYPHSGWAEQNPEDWWRAICACTQSILRETSDPQIAAICVGGQVPSCVPIDKQGSPLRNAILWLDRRSTQQVDWIHRTIGQEKAAAVSGNRIDSYFGGPKWLWFKHNEAERYDRTWKILQANGYIIYRLTGKIAIDPSQAGMCGPFFNLAAGCWDTDMLESLAIDAAKLPPIFPSHLVVGEVSDFGAAQTGVAAGVPVLCGGGDFSFSCLGAGLHTAGTAALMLGTSGNLLIPEPSGWDTRLFNTYHVTGQRLALGGVFAGGSVKWIAQVLNPANPTRFSLFDQSADQIKPGADGLIFLPYLMGERSPIWDPFARGMFVGLATHHTQAHLYRAVLEGVAYAFRSILEITKSTGTVITSVIATDGGAKSLTWLKILANILQVPIRWRENSESTLTGCAFLAAYGSGQVSTFEMIDAWLSPFNSIEPDPDAAHVLEVNYEIFLELYERNKDLFPRLVQNA